MKTNILIAGLVVIAASCNTQPKTGEKAETPDTTGFAAYQAQKLQEQINEGGLPKEGEQDKQSSSSSVSKSKGGSAS